MPATADQTAQMADLRAPHRVLDELATARRQFEKGAAAPVGVVDRLVELADALADSGPLELGVSPRRWVQAQGTVSDLVTAVHRDPTGPLSAARAKEAIGRLRRLMRISAWSSRWRVRTHGSQWAPFALFPLGAVLVAGLTWLLESLAHGQFSSRWLPVGLLTVTAFLLVSMSSIWRVSEAAQARELARGIASAERTLAYCRMPARRFVFATDRRVFAIKLPRVTNRPKALWSLSYPEIGSLERGTTRNDRTITLHAGAINETIDVRILGDENQGYDYQKYHQQALLVILTRRTRSEPVMSPDRTS